MAALTEDKLVRTFGASAIPREAVIVDGQQIFRGSLVTRAHATGRIKAGVDEAAHDFYGMCCKHTSDVGEGLGLGNTAGTEKSLVVTDLRVEVDVEAAARDDANLGKNVFLLDDQTVAGPLATTADIKVGELMEWATADRSRGIVWLGHYSDSDATVG